jgi:hypothetical protein
MNECGGGRSAITEISATESLDMAMVGGLHRFNAPRSARCGCGRPRTKDGQLHSAEKYSV